MDRESEVNMAAKATETKKEEPGRLTGKEALLIQVDHLRRQADRLERLAKEVGTLGTLADEALWDLVHGPRSHLRH